MKTIDEKRSPLSVMEEQPHETVARLFMEHKGLSDVRPYDIERVEGDLCWYFYYLLPEGQVELEVYYDTARNQWECATTSFVAS